MCKAQRMVDTFRPVMYSWYVCSSFLDSSLWNFVRLLSNYKLIASSQCHLLCTIHFLLWWSKVLHCILWKQYSHGILNVETRIPLCSVRSWEAYKLQNFDCIMLIIVLYALAVTFSHAYFPSLCASLSWNKFITMKCVSPT